jgi:hypothetical protein
MSRLTKREWRAVQEAVAARLAGEMDGEEDDPEALQSAQQKLYDRTQRSRRTVKNLTPKRLRTV